MRTAILAVAAYGVFSILGGVIGFLKVRSVASLLAGGLAGAALLFCAYGMQQGPWVLQASLASILVALLLGIRFSTTFRRRPRIMPDLLMVLFSTVTLVAVSIHLVVSW